jgi:hypothetical protein
MRRGRGPHRPYATGAPARPAGRGKHRGGIRGTTAANPATLCAQVQDAIIFGATATPYREITLKKARAERTSFANYHILRVDEAPDMEAHIVCNSGRNGRCRHIRSAIVSAEEKTENS